MADAPSTPCDPFAALRIATPARVGLGRVGQGLPTAPMLAFQLAHARACDAVHAGLDVERLRQKISFPIIVVDSAAVDRTAYLQNPDLGRRLREKTPTLKRELCDVAFVVADGLSATAVHAHGAALLNALAARLSDWKIASVIVARQGRVAIGDPIGEALGAPVVVLLIGERPGLSAADSLSAYITWAPKPGRKDNERNCVSNIRAPGGLSPELAADKIVWLLREMKRLGFSGVALKDRQTASLTDEAPTVEATGHISSD